MKFWLTLIFVPITLMGCVRQSSDIPEGFRTLSHSEVVKGKYPDLYVVEELTTKQRFVVLKNKWDSDLLPLESQ